MFFQFLRFCLIFLTILIGGCAKKDPTTGEIENIVEETIYDYPPVENVVKNIVSVEEIIPDVDVIPDSNTLIAEPVEIISETILESSDTEIIDSNETYFVLQLVWNRTEPILCILCFL